MTANNPRTDSESGTVTASRNGLTAAVFIGGIGFCCYMALLMLFVGCPALALMAYMPFHDAFFCRIISVATSSLVFIVAYFKADQCMKRYSALFVYGALLMLPATIMSIAYYFGAVLPFVVSAVLWGIFGIGFGCLTLLQIILLSTITSNKVHYSITIGACSGTLLFLAIGLQNNPVVLIAETFVLTILAIILAGIMARKLVPSDTEYVDTKRKIPLSALPNELFMVAQGGCFGFVVVVFCDLGVLPTVITLSVGSLGCLIAVFWGISSDRFEISPGVVQRISLVPMIAGLALLPFGGVLWKTACASIMMIAISHSQMMFWVFSIKDGMEFQLHPLRRFAYRQAADWVGLITGMGVGLVLHMFVDFKEPTLPFEIVVAIQIVLSVGAFCAYGADDQRARKYLADIVENASLSEDQATIPSANFEERCKAVCDEYSLTNREREVFRLLARGRNGKVIQKELYIGSSTTKSHIYNIYKKLGISSQQSLIDMVDEQNEMPDKRYPSKKA